MIYTVKDVFAEDVEPGDELDLDGDEYGDNEYAMYNYAKVLDQSDIYKDNEPWVILNTTQGVFHIPAGHTMKVKIVD